MIWNIYCAKCLSNQQINSSQHIVLSLENSGQIIDGNLAHFTGDFRILFEN